MRLDDKAYPKEEIIMKRKSMRIFLVAAIACTMLFAMACGNTETPSGDNPAGSVSQEAQGDSSAVQEDAGDDAGKAAAGAATAVSAEEVYTATVQVETEAYTGPTVLTLTLKPDGTFHVIDESGYLERTGTYSLSNFVVIDMATDDGMEMRGCIQTDETYAHTGIIFDEAYDNGYEQTWTGFLYFGATTFEVAK